MSDRDAIRTNGETIGAPSRRIEELNAAISGHWTPSSEANANIVPLLLPTPQRRVRNFRYCEGFRMTAHRDDDASSMGSLSFVFRMHTCSRSCLELLLQRSPPRLFTAAASSGLRPAPESRSRVACPHLSRSFTTLFSLSCCPPFYVSLQHTVAQEVELFSR